MCSICMLAWSLYRVLIRGLQGNDWSVFIFRTIPVYVHTYYLVRERVVWETDPRLSGWAGIWGERKWCQNIGKVRALEFINFNFFRFVCVSNIFWKASRFSIWNHTKIPSLSWNVKLRPVYLPQRGWGVFPEKLGRVVRRASQNPYPIYDQNLQFSLPGPIYDLTKNLIPYLWPDSWIVRGRPFVAGFI